MVTTGFSKPYIAKYSNVGTAVTYSGGMKLGRGVELKLDIDTAMITIFMQIMWWQRQKHRSLSAETLLQP